MFNRLIDFLKSVLCLLVKGLKLCNSKNDIDIEIVYKSNDYIIVNKPEDVFINNHDKEVSLPIDISIATE